MEVRTMKIASWGLLISLLIPVGSILGRQQAQPQQDDSLAAAARRARDEKRPQAKPTKVWINDDIPQTPGSVSVVDDASSQTSAPAGDSSASAAGTDKLQDANSAQAKNVPAADKKAALEGDLA